MKRTKLLLSLMMIAVSVNFFTACNDDFSEKDAIELNRDYDEADGLAEYTILVVNASQSTTLKSTEEVNSVISGASVTITQEGVVKTDSTDASGMVVFSKLKAGTVAVTIKKTGYSEVYLVANLDAGNVAGGTKASNLIPMIPVTGVTGLIRGQVSYESDLTNKAKEIAANVKVIATVDASSPALSGIKQGVIEQISYSGLSLEATTNTNGEYEMVVPSTADGLVYEVKVSDFEDDQTIYMNTYNGEEITAAADVEKSIPTIFGTNGNLSSLAFSVPPAFVTIGSPSAKASGTGATATAVIKNDYGIQSVNITNAGAKYTDGTYYLNVVNDAANAEAQLKVNIENGVITYADVTSNGDSYSPGAVKFNHQYESFEAYPNVDETGAITGLDINNYGRFLIGNDHLDMLSVKVSGGTGAVITIASMSYTSGGYYPGNIVISNGGSGYEATDKITITVTGVTATDVASGQMNLTSGEVIAIQVTNGGSGYVQDKVAVQISGGGGQGATVDKISVENGIIDYITLSDGGSGYITAPTITIYDLNVVQTATLKLSTDDFTSNGAFKSSYYNVDFGGGGYISAPAVAINAVGTGSGATAIADLGSNGEVLGIIITNPGSNYKAENFVGGGVSVDAQSVKIAGTGTSILNIYLGQGKRSIEN
jgi:hypothetical protein